MSIDQGYASAVQRARPAKTERMLNIGPSDVVAAPFPHVVKPEILPPDLYRALRADFPTSGVFKRQSAIHGVASSRTGSGFDLYRGDDAFTDLTRTSAAWSDFADFLNSEAFVDTFRDVFADHLEDMGLRVDIHRSHVTPDYFEPRSVLTETATVVDKFAAALNGVVDPLRGRQPVDLFTRLDIHRSVGGYAKPPHCDRPNRLCSLIVYFTDSAAVGMEGGDLLIYAHKDRKAVRDYERHPRADSVVQVAKLRPQENLGVFFPCQNNSYHGVTQVLSQGAERDYLYINISARTRSLW
jgi:hypothetical protein